MTWRDAPAVDATIDIQPLDPSPFAVLPGSDDLPNGNAYRITVEPAGALPMPVQVDLFVPAQANGAFATTDGRAWSRVESEVDPQGTVVATLAAPGVVLASTHRDAASPNRLPIVAAEAAVGAVAIAWVWRRRRRRDGPAAR